MRFSDLDYAKGRIEQCVFRTTDGRPIFVTNLDRIPLTAGGEDCLVTYVDLSKTNKGEDAEELKAPVSSNLFNFDSPPLGFVNFDTGARYASRAPVRRYKHGLNSNNVRYVAPPESVAYRSNMGPTAVDWSRELWKKDSGIVNMLMGKYPAITSAMTEVMKLPAKAPKLSLAISRDFSLLLDSNYSTLREEAKVQATGSSDFMDRLKRVSKETEIKGAHLIYRYFGTVGYLTLDNHLSLANPFINLEDKLQEVINAQ